MSQDVEIPCKKNIFTIPSKRKKGILVSEFVQKVRLSLLRVVSLIHVLDEGG
jgi:hypothetical protein